MQNQEKVGILGYGVYIPWQRIQTETVVRSRERRKRKKDLEELVNKVRNGLLLREKTIVGYYEDTITMATESAENALTMSGVDPERIGTVIAGSESKPYAVGQIARHAASFVGIGNYVFTADIEGACNAGMQALSFVESDIKAGKAEYGLAIGSDIAQAPRGDPLEYAAGAGAGAFVLGRGGDFVATIEDIAPYSSLMMDFWRREDVPVPSHLGRTTVEAYVQHVTGAIAHLLQRHDDLRITDFDHITFHQPSGYMPLKACKAMSQNSLNRLESDLLGRMRLTEEDIEKRVKPWLRVLNTGNTYAASTPIAVASILDKSKPGDNILAVSYGSGAYANATWIKAQEGIKRKVGLVPTVDDYVGRKREITLKSYNDHLMERMARIGKKIIPEKILGKIDGLEGELSQSQCTGCRKIYYPPREKCLNLECKGEMEVKRYPKKARLKSFVYYSKDMLLKPKFKRLLEILVLSIPDAYYNDQVLIVDATPESLRIGDHFRAKTSVLDRGGRSGLITYGIAYAPDIWEKKVANLPV